MKRTECVMCRKPMLALRSTLRTCSPKCRQARKRQNDQIEAQIEAQRAKQREPMTLDLPEPLVCCLDCGIRRYEGERCEVCGSSNMLKLEGVSVRYG